MVSFSWLSSALLLVALLSVQMSFTFEKSHLSVSATPLSLYLAQIIKLLRLTANTGYVCLCLIHTGREVAMDFFL